VIAGILPAGAAGRELVAIVATASLASVTISLGVPLLSIVLHGHGVDSFTIGLNTTAGALGSLAAAPLAEPIARRLGAVAAMQLALLLAAAVLLLFPLAVDVRLWALWRILLGAAGATLFIVSEAAINALAPAERRGRILALYATSFSLGYAAGPLLLALTGSEGFLPFLVAAGFLLIAAAPLRLVAGVDRVLAEPERRGRGPGPIALVRRAALPFLGVLVYAVLETSFFALLPVYLLAIGRPESLAALLLSIWIAGNILLQLPIGWLVDRIGGERSLALCALVSATSLLLLDPAVRIGWAVWPLLLFGGGVMGAFYTVSLVILGQRFAASDLVRANAAFVVAFQIGLLIGPATVGGVMRAFGAEAFAWPLALASVAALVAALARPSARATGSSP